MWAMKGQLEDLALKSLDPDAYHQLRGKISSKRHEREEKAKEFLKLIKDKLKERGIDATVEGRAKYFYSIYLKMKEEKKDFNEIYDLIAVRIITNTINHIKRNTIIHCFHILSNHKFISSSCY